MASSNQRLVENLREEVHELLGQRRPSTRRTLVVLSQALVLLEDLVSLAEVETMSKMFNQAQPRVMKLSSKAAEKLETMLEGDKDEEEDEAHFGHYL